MLFSRSRSHPTLVSSARITSPVPTTSCQRASTSPRRSEPLRSALSTSRSASAYARSASARSSAAAASCSIAARSTTSARTGRLASAPRNVRRTSAGAGLRVRCEPVEPRAHGPERVRAASSSPSSGTSGTTRTSASASCSASSIWRRCAGTSRSASAGTRLSTIESAVPRSRAARRNSQGTASA